MSEHPVIEFECSYCLNTITAPAVDCGKQLHCPSCKTVSIVPSRPIDLKLFENIFETVDAQPSATDEGAVQVEVECPPDDLSEILSYAGGNPDSAPNDEPRLQAPSSAPTQVDPWPGKSENPDDANTALVIEGLDNTDLSLVFGIKCSICDSRIQVNESEIGTIVKCPGCFSPVKVVARVSKPKSAARWMPAPATPTGPANSVIFGDVDELRLSPPVERPPVDFLIDPSFGLAPVENDLLAPVAKPKNIVPIPDPESSPPDDALSEDLGAKEIELASLPEIPPSKAPRERSRRELYEAAQRRQIENEQPKSLWSSKSKSQVKSKSQNTGPSQRNNDATEPDTTGIRLNQNASNGVKFDFFWRLAIEMWKSPGLRWRAFLAGTLIGISSGIMHLIAGWYRILEDPTFGQWLWNTTLWAGFGLVPYAIGTLLLWFLCGYIFRESAAGNLQVSTWKVSGSEDALSTILVFSFSFFIAGLPLAFFSFLVMPFRCLVAPPLLLAAWYNKSPFAIVAVDAFQKFNRQWRMWRSLYLFLLALAGVSLIGGLLMIVRVFVLSFATSLAGAIILMMVTIAFTTVTGWHCGQVMRELENTNAS